MTAPSSTASRAVGVWLLACCALLFVLVVVGGITRLTRSGLSITEWQPLVGTLPPLSATDWDELFAKYRQTPQYLQVNHGMSLVEFQRIFWWEYAHRLLARLLGAAFLVPLVVFVARRRVGARLAWKLGGIFLLGAAQGALGWYMVASGLVDQPRVSHLRLTAHLGLALALFAAMFWLALEQLRPRDEAAGAARRDSGLGGLAVLIVVLVGLQALSGALVAGTWAGFTFNTFPLMAGAVVPPGLLSLTPTARNFVDNVVTVQFVHRTLAWALLATCLVGWWRARRAPLARAQRLGVNLLAGAVSAQFALGVSTLLLHVPIPLAAAHQAGAVSVLAAALFAAHELRRPASPPAASR